MESASQDTSLLEGSPVYKATVLPQGASPKDKSQVSSGAGRQYATALTVNLLTLSAGCVYGWASPAEPKLLSNDSPIGTGPVSTEDMSWLVAIPILSGLLGTFIFGILADILGRKKAGIIAAVPYIVSGFLMAFAAGLPALYVSRFLAGIGIGGSMVISPMFVGETASETLRGKLGTYLAVAVNSGIVVGFIVGSVLPYDLAPIILLIFPVAVIVFLARIPETPPYLLKKNRAAEAYRSLQWFRGGRDDNVLDDELDLMKDAAARDAAQSSVSLKDFICHAGTRRALVTNIGLVSNQQLCGVLTILNYTVSIFQESGSSLNATTSTIIVGLLQAVCTYLSSGCIDRVNRKTLLVWSNVVMGVCIATLGGCFYAKSLNYDTSSIGWLPVVCLSVYIVAFAFGMGPVPLVMIAETFSVRVKGLATSIVMSCQLITAFICTKFFSQLSSILGVHGCMFLFAGCCAIGVVFITFYVIETKGKALDEILLEYNGERKQAGHDVYNSVIDKKTITDQVMNELNRRIANENQA